MSGSRPTALGLRGFVCASIVLGVAMNPQRASAQTCAGDRPVAEIGASWDALHAHFERSNRFTTCNDDGAVAEGNSEAVLTLLDKSRNTLPCLMELIRQDPQFRPFVLRHVDEQMDYEALRRVRDQAKTRCPRGLAEVCGQIVDAAEQVLAKAAPK